MQNESRHYRAEQDGRECLDELPMGQACYDPIALGMLI